MNCTENVISQEKKELFILWFVLKILYGLLPIAAGLDKFFNYVTPWSQYINPLLLKLVPVTTTQFMYGVGIIEICAGLLVLSPFTQLGASLVAFWLLAIAVQLVAGVGFYDIAVRDVFLAIGYCTLAQLTHLVKNKQNHSC